MSEIQSPVSEKGKACSVDSFKDWTEHTTTGQPVSSEERQERAKEIAEQLCDHSRWLTHSR